ncbi:MAG: hypothetical protein REI94_04025 [Moraxellaceae bacterium]|nr:hypothetical protein [Moraxellaceae bacterium]
MKLAPLLLAASAAWAHSAAAEGLAVYGYGTYRGAANIESTTTGSNSITGLKPAPSLDILLAIPYSQDTALEFYASSSQHEFEPGAQGKLRAYHLQFGGVKYVEPNPDKGSMYVGFMLGGSQLETPGTRDYQPSFSLYGGYEWRPARNLGLRLEARWIGVLFDAETDVVCSGGCRARIQSGVWSQGSLGVGVGLRF